MPEAEPLEEAVQASLWRAQAESSLGPCSEAERGPWTDGGLSLPHLPSGQELRGDKRAAVDGWFWFWLAAVPSSLDKHTVLMWLVFCRQQKSQDTV